VHPFKAGDVQAVHVLSGARVVHPSSHPFAGLLSVSNVLAPQVVRVVQS
jgi:hypothetical protein